MSCRVEKSLMFVFFCSLQAWKVDCNFSLKVCLSVGFAFDVHQIVDTQKQIVLNKVHISFGVQKLFH